MPGIMLEQLLDKHSGIEDRREYAEVVAMEYNKELREEYEMYVHDNSPEYTDRSDEIE